jgi:pimeloyl-ACP methyl ester carboxylesterase
MAEIHHGMVDANGVRFHVTTAGEGPPLYLLHGWPQTSHCWHKIMPALGESYTVVAPDTRGLGFSSRPESGYDAHTTGDDIAALARALGHSDIALVGHDWGAVAAYTCAARHRNLVRSLTIMDMVMPGMGWAEPGMVPKAGGEFIWQMGFHAVPDIPEMLIRGHEREYLSMWFLNAAYDPTAALADIDFYVSAVKQPGALRAGLEYYKAFFQSGEQVRLLAEEKLDIPVLAIAGEAGLGTWTLQSMEQVANDVRGGVVERCGHWMAEERPDHIVELLTEFLTETSQNAAAG